MLIPYSCSINYQENTVLLKTYFATVINMHLYFYIGGKKMIIVVYIQSNLFICSQRPGSIVFVCLVQRFLDKHKESGGLNVI